ncbi:hypothetical protein BASA83_013680 [Batrachochytrium salamandrivorans]|nr:hypothetical protein BASA83_013680 [Batrachochytrium salamandrivorans]
MTVSTAAITKPVARAMETATAEKEATGANSNRSRSNSSRSRFFFSSSKHISSSLFQHDLMEIQDTSDIHDYSHQQQELHQSQQQHNNTSPVAIIDTGYYADIVQQPVRVCCSEYYNNGTVSHPIEPCIAVQLA